MRSLKTRLHKVELKHPAPCSMEQEIAFSEILSYLDDLAVRKACGDTQVQAEIEAVNQFLRAQ